MRCGGRRVGSHPAFKMGERTASASPLSDAAQAPFQLKLTGFSHNHTAEQVINHIVEVHDLNITGSTCVTGAPKGYCKLFFRSQEDLSKAKVLLNSLQTPVLSAKNLTAKSPGQQISEREHHLDKCFGNVLFVVNPLLLWSFLRNRHQIYGRFVLQPRELYARALQNIAFCSQLGTIHRHNDGKKHRQAFLTCCELCVTLTVRLSCGLRESVANLWLRRAICILSRRHELLHPAQFPVCVKTMVRYSHHLKSYESSFAFHPRFAMIATGFYFNLGESGDLEFDYARTTLWKLHPDTFQSEIRTLPGHRSNRTVKSAAFHPHLPLLATGSDDCTAKLWRLYSGSFWAVCRDTLLGHKGGVCSVMFHPRSPLLATGSFDGTARIWQLNSDYTRATCVSTLQGHSGGVLSVVFHARLPLLLTGNPNKCVKLWNLNADGTHVACIATLDDQAEEEGSVDFHPLLPLFASGSRGGTFKMWRLNSDGTNINCVATINSHSNICSVGFHPRLPLLATGSADGSTQLWQMNSDGTNAVCAATLLGHKDCVRHVAFHHHLSLLATGTGDTIKIWNEWK